MPDQRHTDDPRSSPGSGRTSPGGDGPEHGRPGLFTRPWLEHVHPRLAGTMVPGLAVRRAELQFICLVGDRVLPWKARVREGALVAIDAGFVDQPDVAIGHSRDAGRLLLGLEPVDPVGPDDLALERWDGRRWVRHPVPPRDEQTIDVAINIGAGRRLTWIECVERSPIGDLHIERSLAGGTLETVATTTARPTATADVISRVGWPDLMDDRLRASSTGVVPRLEWRGSAADIHTLRVAIRAMRASLDDDPNERQRRDRVLVDAAVALRQVGRRLRADGTAGDPLW
jgi:hypothetical protein